jgi:hypothetical protein
MYQRFKSASSLHLSACLMLGRQAQFVIYANKRNMRLMLIEEGFLRNYYRCDVNAVVEKAKVYDARPYIKFL